MLITYTKLSEKALKAIIEEYITREGTEYGVKEYTFEQKIEQIRQQEHSIKDELLTILICSIFALVFIPYTQPTMMRGFEILKSAPQEFWWAVLIVFSGSFGMSTLKNINKK